MLPACVQDEASDGVSFGRGRLELGAGTRCRGGQVGSDCGSLRSIRKVWDFGLRFGLRPQLPAQVPRSDGEIHKLNFVNNYYKPGPSSTHFVALTLNYYENVPDQASWYIAGNVMPGKFSASEVSKSYAWGDVQQASWIKTAPLYDSYVTTQTAEEAYGNVLANVGANLPALDDHDKRIIDASDASDGSKSTLSKLGYTNVEMYLNELAGDFK